MNAGDDEPAYVATVLTLYLDLPDTPLRPSPRDQSLARKLHQQAVPLPLVESALLLGTLRRLIRPSDLPPLPKIRSLAYFLPVIDELQQQPLPDGYLDYLRLKLQQLAQPARPMFRKLRFLMIANMQGLSVVTTKRAEAETAAERIAEAGPQAPDAAPAAADATLHRVPAKRASPRTKKGVEAPDARRPREGSKAAQVVSLLQRDSGATLAEIMERMGWQKHTVRGFMAGAMKKAGYAVESFKPEGGQRS